MINNFPVSPEIGEVLNIFQRVREDILANGFSVLRIFSSGKQFYYKYNFGVGGLIGHK